MSAVLHSGSLHSLPLVSPSQHGGSFLGEGVTGAIHPSEALNRLVAFDGRVAPTLGAMERSPVITDTTLTAKRIRAVVREIKRVLGPYFSIVPNQTLFSKTILEPSPRLVVFDSFYQAILASMDEPPADTSLFHTGTIGIFEENDLVTIYGWRDWFQNRAMYLLSIQKVQNMIDTLVGVVDKGMIIHENNTLSQEVKSLKRQNFTDPLTGISNRGAMNQKIRELKELNSPVYCMMFDIDHFKGVNDTHGHAVGDIILEDVSMVLAKKLEDYFVLNPAERLYEIPGNHLKCGVFRMGGEEFCCLVPDIDDETARNFAEYVRKTIEGYQFIFPIQGPPPSIGGLDITISVGIAHVQDSSKMSESSLLEHADAALYRAKHGGRNQVVMYDSHVNHIVPVHAIATHGESERRGLRV